jgi:mono/diheme cytochrome c family protein
MRGHWPFQRGIRAAALLFFSGAGILGAQSPQNVAPATFEGTVQPFLARNCQGCHNAKASTAGLNLEALGHAGSVEKDRDRWEQIVSRIKSGAMPPAGMPRPDASAVQAVTHWIEAEFSRQDLLIRPDPGRVIARRLNRAEYSNTVRDLLGVGFRAAEEFPQDDSGYGFDNIGDVLSLSPILMEKYLSAAEKISRSAVFGDEAPKPSLLRYLPHRRVPPPVSLTEYDETGLSLASAINQTHRFPADAEYLFKFVLNGGQPAGSEPRTVAVWVDGRQVQQFVIETTVMEGQSRQFRTRVAKGEHLVSVSFLHHYEGLPANYGGPNPSHKPVPPPRVRPGAPAATAATAAVAPALPGSITSKVEELDIGGPFDAKASPPTESLRLVFTCGHAEGHHTAGCPRKILSDLARRAYRRAVTTQETNTLLGLYSKVREKGDSFEEGIAVAIQYLLVSPDFLFRISRNEDRGAAASPISQYERASRLSYFLWSSMPDEELLRLAAQGKLRSAGVVDAQVRRMLKDPKAEALVDNFAGQWLEIRNIEVVKPDPDQFVEFDDLLRLSMKGETKRFLASIIAEDRSILDIIAGRYTFLNERLARFYKIPGITGMEFRKVDLTGNPERSGILTQASVLTVSSYATRTSPVLRGKWILDNILNTPPPPPPPDVPNLSVSGVGASVSLRQQLEKHRENAMCASCHSKMDPLGFGLENYDAIGAWRVQDGKVKIDPSGKLPDGRNFSGPEGLKAVLLAEPDALAQSVTEKLLTYALGRGLQRFDKPVIAGIVKRATAGEYRFSSIVLGIVHSMPFEMQTGDQ